MHAQHGRNYRFFDAPVGLIFTIDRILRQGSWLDYGMFLQNVMTAAREATARMSSIVCCCTAVGRKARTERRDAIAASTAAVVSEVMLFMRL
jgi:nitroreductase